MRALSANRGDAPFRYGDLVRFLNTLRRQCPQQNVLECSLHGTVRSSGKRRPRRTQPCYNGIYRESARIRTADPKFVRLRSPSWMATARNSPLGARPALIRIRRTAAAIGRCIPDNFSALIGAVRKIEGIRFLAVVLSRRESRARLDR